MDLPYEKGVARHSELYDATPSALARELLHYLQRIGHFTCDTHYIVERDYMESYLLFYVLRGTMEVTSEGETVRIGAEECGFFSCYTPHCYRAVEPLEYIWIHLDGANTGAFCRAIRREHGAIIRTDHPQRILSQMQQILQQMREIGQLDEVTTSRRLNDLMCSLLYVGSPHEVDNPQIAAMQRYLLEHLSEDLSAAGLAREFHLSESQLNRQFKAHTGQAPHEYLMNLRVNHAKTLLKETRLSISEIAAAVGYSYDSSFAAAFHSRVGMSPRQFRKMPI